MKVPSLDLHAQWKTVEKDVRAAIDHVFEHQNYILGPEVEALEKAMAEVVGCKHAITLSSGTDALLISLMALDIGPGDEVITTPYTFFATAGVIARLRAKPVFVDITSHDYNLNPDLISKAITSKTKALIPVHLFGQSAELNPILKMCAQKNIPVIEDAAQAIGTTYQGKPCGSFGFTACFSFFPSKNLGTLGDGGFVTTQSDSVAEKIKILRAHGSKPKYHHKMVGGNFRMDTLMCAAVLAKLKYLDGWTQKREMLANVYNEKLKPLAPFVQTPVNRAGDRHVYNQYVIRAQNRDALIEHLKSQEIATAIYYPVPMHLQECFKDLGYKPGDFPESEKAAKETLAIPMFPELSSEQQNHVIESIQTFYSR